MASFAKIETPVQNTRCALLSTMLYRGYMYVDIQLFCTCFKLQTTCRSTQLSLFQPVSLRVRIITCLYFIDEYLNRGWYQRHWNFTYKYKCTHIQALFSWKTMFWWLKRSESYTHCTTSVNFPTFQNNFQQRITLSAVQQNFSTCLIYENIDLHVYYLF